MKTKNALIIDNVTKLYNNHRGIKNIAATINSGDIIAFVGPNGAGKTTLAKSIAGLLRLSEGKVLLFGDDTASKICRPQIGYMQSDLSFYYRMTVYEILDFICKVKYGGRFSAEIDLYLKRYDLYGQRNILISELSSGMRQKLSIIMALIGDPKLIILDEPANGVDTYGIIQFKEDVLKRALNGSIVIITGHVLDLLEKICTRCIFLKEGQIAVDILMADNKMDLEKMYEKIYVL